MTLEIAILGPALLLVVFTLVQTALWFHARSLALAAAQEGVTAARAYQAPPNAGQARAETFLADHASDTLRDPQVSVTTTPGHVRVDIHARVISVVPGVPGMTVDQHAEAPVERFTNP